MASNDDQSASRDDGKESAGHRVVKTKKADVRVIGVADDAPVMGKDARVARAHARTDSSCSTDGCARASELGVR